jgi:succinyl-diaminopimelate desuccinylase
MDNYLKNMTNSLKKLISFESVPEPPLSGAPYGQKIDDALKYTLGLCRTLEFEPFDGGGLYGYADAGNKDGEIFAVLCHLDVVPFNRSEWTREPLGEVSGGKIYGRGALDDKGPTIAALYAVRALQNDDFRFTKKIRFIFGLDEETGEWKSVSSYFEKHGMPPVGIAPDADFPVINSEKGKVDFILSLKIPEGCHVIDFSAGKRSNIVPDKAEAITRDFGLADAAKERGFGVLSAEKDGEKIYTVSAAGTAAHGAHPEKGDNAAMKLVKFFASRGIEPYVALHGELSDYNGNNAGIGFEDGISGKLTLNAGVFSVDKENGLLNVEIDVRYPHNVTGEQIEEILKNSKAFFKVKQNGNHRPLLVSGDDPLVTALLSAYNSVAGENARPISIGGATFARALDYGVAFGPCFPDSPSAIHGADEFISLDDLLKTAKIYYEAFKLLT